jgi:hypothetical protein
MASNKISTEDRISIGNTFGRWTVIGLPEYRDYISPCGRHRHKPFVSCKCQCGVVRPVSAKTLLNGSSVSCGCYRVDNAARRIALLRKTHGESVNFQRTPEYASWLAMRRRCADPHTTDYKHYGGRGITVCDRWQNDYVAFLEDMGRKPGIKYSVERIDNDGNYEPGNCKWANQIEQCNNTRSNRLICMDGDTRTVSQWAKISGLKPYTIFARLRLGWDPAAAIFTAVKHRP